MITESTNQLYTKDNPWLEIWKTGRYVYGHEPRGSLVAILPWRNRGVTYASLEYLVHMECTPSWQAWIGDPKPIYANSITGAIDDGESPREAAVRELHEEGGILVSVDDLMELGNSYAAKVTDSYYHLFAVNADDGEVTEIDPDGGLEESEYPKWVGVYEVGLSLDPIVAQLVWRLHRKLLVDMQWRA